MLQRLFLLIALLFAMPALAQSVSQQEHTKVELISEAKAPAAGKRVTLGIVMTPAENWHTYWENPGDSGMPTIARWTLPEGVTAGPLRYPMPETFVVAGIMNHVYSGRNILLVDLDIPSGLQGRLPIALKLDWLVCDDKLCVPESANLAIDLPLGDGRSDPAVAPLFANARAALPRTLAEPAAFQMDGERIRLKVPLADADRVTGGHFFSLGDDNFRFAGPQTLTRTADALIVEGELVPGATPASISGVMRIEYQDGPLGLSLSANPGVVAAGEPLAVGADSGLAGAFLPAFGLALLGGLLLNLMPCVFPILSLKALSLTRAGESQQSARLEGLAYAAGVILICVLLGAVAITLARAGNGAGWAFQLQDPRVILLLLLLTLAIGLNFAGLFEMTGKLSAGQTLASRPGTAGAFWTGALAAFVATPCTGPFMATALGAALILPWAAGLAVFAGLGLGIALPFLAIGFVPALRKRLPRPGQWMVTFRQILAIPMLLTALALAWVLGRQAGLDGLMLGLLAALLVGLGLWWLGLRQQRQKRLVLPLLVTVVAAVAAPAALGHMPTPGQSQTADSGALAGVTFSTSRLSELRASGTPTFLYFTADWCLTCKVNEAGALSSSEVANSFRQTGIQVMVGDWTKPDPEIARFLEERGRAGIPLYLFYGADGSVRELPQLLTVGALTALASNS